ncbi:unnamed protein product [Eruca vesicaria subsp. sativa]|uniref:DUF4378 domain-containing protein n=1 Tax=Eruca vesicaria subsp. sativa TaxID=29727 RepID=A0ABC8K4M4_ERUVS|nr:unnamed protein product [Eruca vesicaria subsp. sativa]
MEVVERKRSRGGFLNLFDWPGKSRKKKLFSSGSSLELSEELKQTKQNEVDENGKNWNYNPRSDSSCCASSVTSEDGQGTRAAPSVVARLMGLESLPVPNVQEPRFNPVLDPFLHSRKTTKWNAYENLGYVNLHSDYDGVSWEHLDSRMNDGRNRGIERFQSETFPHRVAKPISVANSGLLSPIRSPRFVPSRNPVYVMEAASRMIEPSPRTRMVTTRTRFSPSDSPSSVPMRIRDLREKLKAAKNVSSRQVSNEKRTSTSVITPSSMVKSSSEGLKSKVKPPHVSAEAKASTLSLSVHTEKAESKKRIVNSQNGLRGPHFSTGKRVVKQNDQKQNCRDNQHSNQKSKVVNKVPVESGSGKNTSLPLSRKKSLHRSKKPPNGMQECGISNDKRIKRGESVIKSNITIDGSLHSGKDDLKKEVDVISFTFSSPVKGKSSHSLSSSTQERDQETDSAVSFDMFGGSSLNVLLEEKLRELTSKLESSSCSLTQEESSRSSTKNGVNEMVSSSPEYDKSTQNGLEKVLSESESVSDCTLSYDKQKLQVSSYGSTNESHLAQDESELSESVITLTYSEDKERLDWEVEYISVILGSDQLMVKEYALGMATDILPASLFNELEGCGVATSAKLKRKTVFDFVSKCLELKCEQMLRGSCRGLLFEHRNWLAEELNREIQRLKKMREMMMDELVDKDMSSLEGSWLDFERETYEEGIDIEGEIVSTLVDDLVNELVSVFKEEH